MNGLMREAFIAHIFSNYQRHCSGLGIAPNTASFLDFLLRHQLIVPKEIHHYTILKEYQAWRDQETHRNKTETIRALAAAYGLHENTIWNVLKDHDGKFG